MNRLIERKHSTPFQKGFKSTHTKETPFTINQYFLIFVIFIFYLEITLSGKLPLLLFHIKINLKNIQLILNQYFLQMK